jgi:hypothetical protein
MSRDRFDVLERFTPLFECPESSFEGFLRRRDRKRRRRHIALGASGAVVCVALVAGALMVLPPGDGPSPVEVDVTIGMSEDTVAPTTSTSPTPAEPSAVDVADGFVAAYGAGDADAVVAALTDDFVGGIQVGDIGRTPREIGLVLSLSEAQGVQQIVRESCAEVDRSSAGVVVRCPFDSHGFGSAEIGLGPYTGHWWELTVRDGEIVAARMQFNLVEQMIQQTIDPFGRWVETNHPEDIQSMYTNGDLTDFRLGEESARLFAQHLDEYVAEQAAVLDTAERFVAGWVAGDGEAVAALFAVGGTWEDFDAGTLPALHDWYRAVGWQHSSTGCVLRPPYGNVGCSYTFENDLTRFLGEVPIGGLFALEIADGEITTVTNRFNPRHADVWQTFLQWVADHHPDDVERMYTADTSFALWDASSVELWDQYVDDFTASDEGYVARAESICTAAHARLNDELETAGIELDASAEDDGSGLQLTPHDDQDVQAYEETARRIEDEVLVQLRAIPPPATIRAAVDHAYDVLERFANGEQQDPAEFRSQVANLGLGLDHCTFVVRD